MRAPALKLRYIGQSVVNTRLETFFKSYSKEAFNLYKYYAKAIEEYFYRVQTSVPAEERGRYWTNHTHKAALNFYAKAYQLFGKRIGLELGNNTWYAYNLENDFGGRFASFPDLLAQFAPQIEDELEYIPGRIK